MSDLRLCDETHCDCCWGCGDVRDHCAAQTEWMKEYTEALLERVDAVLVRWEGGSGFARTVVRDVRDAIRHPETGGEQ